jgi:hypothetical protein
MHPYGRTFQILNWNNGNPPFYCGVNWVSTRRLGDSLGYSVCGIPLAENTGGGSDLQGFVIPAISEGRGEMVRSGRRIQATVRQ